MPTLPAHDKRNIIAPHVVILGAGASKAALPTGDASGKPLPLMRNFVDTLGLGSLLVQHGVQADHADFESLYDALVSSGDQPELVTRLEQQVFEYFNALRLPESATIYDFLVLALRKKDLIATFNWDPFLMQAYERNMHITEPPQIAWLHGSVACGVCHKHRWVGFSFQRCPVCGRPFKRCRLLYPVQHKDYDLDPFIAGEWRRFRKCLRYAYVVTIFGYSAPKTDASARSAMLDAWQNNPGMELGQVEIVDIAPERRLRENWEEFFVSHHYALLKTIRHCLLARFPRRTCEALYGMTMMCQRTRPGKYPLFRRLDRLQRWFQPVLEEEQQCEQAGKGLLSADLWRGQQD